MTFTSLPAVHTPDGSRIWTQKQSWSSYLSDKTTLPAVDRNSVSMDTDVWICYRKATIG